jgi:hypothetical protein
LADPVQIAPEYFYWIRDYLHKLRSYVEKGKSGSASNQEEASKAGPEQILKEIDAALDWTAEHYSSIIPVAADMQSRGLITFEYLWTLLPPNVLVIGHGSLGDARVWRVRSHRDSQTRHGDIVRLLDAEYIEYDGHKVGPVKFNLTIPSFEGMQPINELEYSPLHLQPNRTKLWDSLIQRCEKQLAFHAHRFKIQEHRGHGLIMTKDGLQKFNVCA